MLVQVRRTALHSGGEAGNRETLAGDHCGAELCRCAGDTRQLEEDLNFDRYNGHSPKPPQLFFKPRLVDLYSFSLSELGFGHCLSSLRFLWRIGLVALLMSCLRLRCISRALTVVRETVGS